MLLREVVRAKADDLASGRNPIVVKANTSPDTSPLRRQKRVDKAAELAAFRALNSTFEGSMTVERMTFPDEHSPARTAEENVRLVQTGAIRVENNAAISIVFTVVERERMIRARTTAIAKIFSRDVGNRMIQSLVLSHDAATFKGGRPIFEFHVVVRSVIEDFNQLSDKVTSG